MILSNQNCLGTMLLLKLIVLMGTGVTNMVWLLASDHCCWRLVTMSTDGIFLIDGYVKYTKV